MAENKGNNKKNPESSEGNENTQDAVKPVQPMKKSNFLTFLIDLLTREKGGAIAGFFLTLAGVIGFWLSPVKTGIFHLIWEEDAIIEIRASEENVIVGNEFSVSVLVYSNSVINVSKGILTLSFPEDALELVDGKTEFETGEIEHAKIFPAEEGKPILLRAKEVGEFEIVANLKTKYKSYIDTVTINSDFSFGKPTVFNFSGKWYLQVGRSTGEMELVETNEGGGYQLSGTYHLDSGEQGILRGNRDGHSFIVNLIKRNELEKWFLKGEYAVREDTTNFQKYITVEGTAELLRVSDEFWKPLGDPVSFSANTRTD